MKILLLAARSPLCNALGARLSRLHTVQHRDPLARSGAENAPENIDLVLDLASRQTLLESRGSFSFAAWRRLLEPWVRRSVPVMLLSDSRVFNADGERHREQTPLEATDPIGRQLQQREQWLGRALPQHVVLRTGPVISEARGALVWELLQRFGTGTRIVLPSAGRCQPTPAADVARAISAIIDQLDCGADGWGAFHYASSDVTDCLEFARLTLLAAAGLKAFEGAEPSLEADEAAECELIAPLLNCERVRDTFGIRQSPWRAAITGIVKSISEEQSV